MQYLKQCETRFDSHGHWNTVHTVEITLQDALAVLKELAKAYPAAFHANAWWKIGAVNLEELNDPTLQEVCAILEKIVNAKP